MPPRVLAALSLVAAMALTGANVAFGKAIAATIPVYIFVLYRFAVASLALAPIARSEAGPAFARMNLGQLRDLLLMALLGLVGFTVRLCEASFVVLGKRLAPPYRPLRRARSKPCRPYAGPTAGLARRA